MTSLRRLATVLLIVGAFATIAAAAVLPDEPEIDANDGEVEVNASFKLAVNLAEESVKSVRYGWTFDTTFSQAMVDAFDDDENGALDASELRDASQAIFETIKPYNYFLVADRDGKPLDMTAPTQHPADFSDGKLTVSFETQPARPLPLSGKIIFGVYDPTQSFRLIGDDELTAGNAPARCRSEIVRPDFEMLLATDPEVYARLSADPTGPDVMRMLATRIELTC